MHLHFLGIGGTFMSGLALLAKAAGHKITGSDLACYPPVCDLLKEQGIDWVEGYEDATLALKADQVIIGNAMKRGMPVIEAVLNYQPAYLSGPQWLAENILKKFQVIAVAGTHGKTTTTAMMAHILEKSGLDIGFLIGGVIPDFGTNARMGKSSFFVIEADEYDSAFFDKGPKFMHYHPKIAVLNNLEFDHADIYPNLEAIKTQFHYFLKTIPSQGMVIKPQDDSALNQVLEKGIFSRLEEMKLEAKINSKFESSFKPNQAHWQAEIDEKKPGEFKVFYRQEAVAEINWSLVGDFNIQNALGAMAASFHAGVCPKKAADALSSFKPVKRRLERVASYPNHITLYDDFAHHPTAIFKTLQALKKQASHVRILVVLELASYTMRSGVHAHDLKDALKEADQVFILNNVKFNLISFLTENKFKLLSTTDEILRTVIQSLKPGDGIVIMSNRGFEALHERLNISILRALEQDNFRCRAF